MSVEIKVNRVRESGIFHGGDEVNGTVEIRGPLDFPYYDDSKVHIVWSGSSETAHAVQSHVYADHAIFFQSEKVLFTGIVDLKNGASRIWQFSFVLPEQTEPEWGQPSIKRKKRSEVFLMTPHPLPQSTALSGQLPHPWQALVSYTLHAKVSGKWGWREHKIVLTVVPKPAGGNPPAELVVQSKQFTHSSSRLLQEDAQRKRSMSKWLGDKLASSTPKVVFSVKAQTLQTLTPGQQIPIRLQLHYDTEKSNLSSLPELRLLDVKYKIMAKTQIWGDEFMSMALTRELAGRTAPRTREFRRHLQFDAHFLVNGQNIEVDQYKADDGTMYHITLDQALVPSLKTYNLNRSYEAAVSFNFECGGKKCKAKFLWPLDIVSNENYIPPIQLVSSNDDSEAVKTVGKMALKGAVMVMTTILGG
jgi:hypothetical protein